MLEHSVRYMQRLMQYPTSTGICQPNVTYHEAGSQHWVSLRSEYRSDVLYSRDRLLYEGGAVANTMFNLFCTYWLMLVG